MNNFKKEEACSNIVRAYHRLKEVEAHYMNDLQRLCFVEFNNRFIGRNEFLKIRTFDKTKFYEEEMVRLIKLGFPLTLSCI